MSRGKRDLYHELGVGEGAGQDEIKRAFRRRAKRAHPDAGGSAEEFRRAQQAYLVLSDPEARARYDRDGTHDGDSARAAASAPVSMLADLVCQLADRHAPGTDLLAKARELLEARCSEARDRAAATRRSGEKLRAVAGRITVAEPGAENVLREALLHQAGVADAKAAAQDRAAAELDGVLEALRAYKYRADHPEDVHVMLGGAKFTFADLSKW